MDPVKAIGSAINSFSFHYYLSVYFFYELLSTIGFPETDIAPSYNICTKSAVIEFDEWDCLVGFY